MAKTAVSEHYARYGGVSGFFLPERASNALS
jgi:hypothetical protein